MSACEGWPDKALRDVVQQMLDADAIAAWFTDTDNEGVDVRAILRAATPEPGSWTRDEAFALMDSARAERDAARARIAELEAQVRERDEALKVAGESLRWLVNVVCGVGKSGDYPSINEDGAAVDAAKSALAHPLIGGEK